MKKLLALLLAMSMLLSLAACGAKSADTSAAADTTSTAAATEEAAPADAAATEETAPAEEPSGDYEGKTLIVALDEEPASLLPQAGTCTGSVQLIAATCMVYLQGYDRNGEIKNELLESYEWNDDGTACTMHIRQGIMAADGTPYTASDVLFSFKLGLEGSNPSSYELNTDAWTVDDEYTLTANFTDPYPLFTSIWTNDYTAIVSESVYDSIGSMEAAGLAPAFGGAAYNFVEWVPGQYIMLEYNPDYWDTSYIPAYQYIKLTFIADSASRCLAVQSGDADVAIDVGLSNTLAYEGSSDVTINPVQEPSVVMLWANNGNEYLADQTVREALSYLIDFDSLNAIFSNGMADKCQTSIPTSSPYYLDEYTFTYDPDTGIKMLQDAGYGDGFDLFLFSEPTEGFSDACELIQYELSLANINVTIDYANQTNYFDTVQNYKYDLLLTSITGNMPRFMAAYYNDSYQLCGGINLDDEELHNLATTTVETLDENERTDAWHQIQQRVIDETLTFGVCSGVGYHLSNPNITGFVPGAAGNVLVQYLQ